MAMHPPEQCHNHIRNAYGMSRSFSTEYDEFSAVQTHLFLEELRPQLADLCLMTSSIRGIQDEGVSRQISVSDI